MKTLAIDPTEPDELAEPEDEWEHAQRIQNDIDVWLYKAYMELGILDQETAVKITNYLHEEIRKKYEVYEAPEVTVARLEHNSRMVKQWLRGECKLEKKRRREDDQTPLWRGSGRLP